MAKLLEITGKAISGEWGQDDDTGTGIPVLRTTNFTNEGFVNYKNVVTRSISKKNIAEKYLRHGDVIIEKSGGSDKQPVGRVIFFEGEENKYLFNNFTGLLRVQNPEEWLPKYVFYALYAYYRNGGTRAFENRTTGLHNLQVDNYVKSVDIPKLSYRKQQHICETLDHVRAAVAYREQQLTKLDELVKARFVEMFGDPISNTKRWDVIELGNLTGIGSSKRIFEKEYVSEGIPFYRTKEIVELSKGNPISTELYITEKRFLEIKEQYGVPQKGDLLISAVGTIGVIWIVDEKNDFYFKDGNLIRVDSSDRFNSTYMKTLLESLIAEYKKQMSSGTAYSALTISGLMKMKIYDVPLSLQTQFAAFVAEVDKSKLFVGSAAAHKPFDIGFFSQKHCATPCKRGIISSKHMIFH